MSRLTLTTRVELWPTHSPFRITGKTWTSVSPLIVELSDGTHIGRGEGVGVYYRGETAETMLAQVEAVRDAIEAGITREELLTLMPRGGARSAVDCALWEVEANRLGTTVMALAGIEKPRPLVTVCTVGADTPEAMAAQALAYGPVPALKLKLTEDPSNADRVRAVRAACPDSWIGVDANQGLTRASTEALLPVLAEARVALLEQPVRVGDDAALDGLKTPIPIAADESAQGLADLPSLVGRYQMVNIKLDKCGGLTEALAIAKEAEKLGLKVMVGNMLGTSLSMAPAYVVGQYCDVVDLDGPLLLGRDRDVAARYENGVVTIDPAVWGGDHVAAAA
jgi:L-alanine-DL-glutamate epimerase-like enolase superfamily enzyme